MKMSKRVLAITLSLVMMISLIPMSFGAKADRKTASVEEYISPANLGVVAETLLKDLGVRAKKFAPAALALVFKLAGPMKEQAAADGIEDAYTASTEELCKSLIKFADAKLAELNLNGQIGSYSGLIGALGIDVKDLNSVNGIFTALYTALNKTINNSRTWGDLADLNEKSLGRTSGRNTVVMQTTDKVATPNYDMLNGLFGFLSDNAAVIGRVVSKGLNLGSINGTIKTFAKIDAEDLVNGYIKNLPAILKELVYDNLLAEKNEDGDPTPAYADSAYKAYTIDELLASALINLVNTGNSKGGVVPQAEAKAATGMTLYQLIGAYADKAIANFAIDPLNNNLKEVIANAISGDQELKATVEKILNMDYKFTDKTFNFASYAQSGLFENLNNILVTILNTMLTDSAKKAVALEAGDNSKLTSNLTKACKFALTTLAGYKGGDIGGFDFSKYTAEAIEKLSLEDMAVSVLGLFMNAWFGENLPASATTLEQVAAWSEYKAIEKFYCAKYPQYKADLEARKDLVFNGNEVLTGKSQAYWYNTMCEIGMDLAEWVLDYISNEGTIKKFTKAAAGADWVKKADNVVDWALNYVDGFPAITDELKATEAVYPEADTFVAYGPFYKANVILNDLFPLSFINGASDGYFAVDVEKLFFEKLLPSITDFTLDDFATTFTQNDNKDNPFNKPLLESAVGFIDNLLFSLFEYDAPDDGVDVDKAATYWSAGFKGKGNAADKYYLKATETPEKLPIPADEAPDFTPGDIDGNGQILADDARLALRCSAKLEVLTDVQMKAADVDGNNQVLADDARQILRFSAKLQQSFDKAA
ncbi:MAG: dockerin type I repeat-containing protein [Clostridia bacterium]|nr:dockerin type I repeat-containing protein [Clostridia bacterium]